MPNFLDKLSGTLSTLTVSVTATLAICIEINRRLISLTITSDGQSVQMWRDLRIFLVVFWGDQLVDELMAGVTQFGRQYTDDQEEWEQDEQAASHPQAAYGLNARLQQQDSRCCRCIETLSLIRLQVSVFGDIVEKQQTSSSISKSIFGAALQAWRNPLIGIASEMMKKVTTFQQILDHAAAQVESLRLLWLTEFQTYAMTPREPWDRGSMGAWKKIMAQCRDEISTIIDAKWALSDMLPPIKLGAPFGILR